MRRRYMTGTNAAQRIAAMQEKLRENAWITPDAGHGRFGTHPKRKRKREKRWLQRRLRAGR